MTNKITKFELRQRKGAKGVMSGATTELFMNGKKMTCVTSVKVEVGTNQLAKMTLEVIGAFNVIGKFGPEQVAIVNKK